MIVDCAVKWKIPDSNRRKVISKMTGVNIDKKIEFLEEVEGGTEQVERTSRRRLAKQEPERTGLRKEGEMSDSTSSVTTFEEMYDFFLAGITDDMFMEMTKEDTEALLEEILLASLPHFEFPRKNIFTLDLTNKTFSDILTQEEMMIIRQYMISE